MISQWLVMNFTFTIRQTLNARIVVRWKANGQITSVKNLLNKCPTDFQMRTLGKKSAYYTTKVPSFRRNKQNFVPSSLKIIMPGLLWFFVSLKFSSICIISWLDDWSWLSFFCILILAVFISEVVSVVEKNVRRDPESWFIDVEVKRVKW